jgi:hypothetical protein
MNKYDQPENARVVLAMITFLLNQGNDNILVEMVPSDGQVEIWFRKKYLLTQLLTDDAG